MWTTIVGLVCIYGVTASTQDNSGFYDDGEPIDGSETTACHLATPAITQYKWSDFHVNLTNIPLIDQHTYHRVGYVKTIGVFDYVGCANVTGASGVKDKRTDMPRDIGLCYSFCNTDYIGISMSTCLCFTSTPHYERLWACGDYCDNAETWCGDANDATSLYKAVPAENLQNVTLNDLKNCTLYDGLVGKAVWKDCDQNHGGLCSSIAGDGQQHLPDAMSWSTFTVKCFEEQQTPAVFNDKKYNMTFWLGRIKTTIVKKVEGGGQDPSDQVENGYVRKDYNNDQIILSFLGNTGGRRKRLCVNESTTTTTTKTTTTPTTASTSTTTLASIIFKDKSDITTQSTDKATKSARRESRESTSFIGSLSFYIIVGVSALILVLILLVVICCCIRRKRRRGNVHIEAKHSDTTQERGPEGDDVTYDVCDTPVTSGSGEPRDTPHDPEYDTTTTLATGSGRSLAQGDDADSSTVYNTTQDFSNDIYDHAGENKDKPVVVRDNIYNTLAPTEDLYDHTSTDKSKQEFIGGNVYSTSRTVCKVKGGEVDDTYDTASGVATQTGGKHHDAGGMGTQQGGT